MLHNLPISAEGFKLGSVVLAAQDGTLARLGYDVRKLGLSCLGVVTEEKSSKCLVYFPDLKLNLWLPKNELADVQDQTRKGESAFAQLLPLQMNEDVSLVWWISSLSYWLNAKSILGFELAPLRDIWDHNRDDLEKFFQGDADLKCLYLGLGIEELDLPKWHQIETMLGKKLLFARFLPAGMHKLEVALYLKA